MSYTISQWGNSGLSLPLLPATIHMPLGHVVTVPTTRITCAFFLSQVTHSVCLLPHPWTSATVSHMPQSPATSRSRVRARFKPLNLLPCVFCWVITYFPPHFGNTYIQILVTVLSFSLRIPQWCLVALYVSHCFTNINQKNTHSHRPDHDLNLCFLLHSCILCLSDLIFTLIVWLTN